MERADLTLATIDGMRHLTTSEDVVRAVGFAVRAGHENRTAYRFVTALTMMGQLTDRRNWGPVLLWVMDLEHETDNERG